MYELVKKTIVVFISLTFLASGLAAAFVENGVSVDASKLVKKVTLCRYGPDGSETPIEIDIAIKENQNYLDAIIEKCNELLEDDIEINNYFNSLDENESENDSAFEFGYNANVVSWGRGFHFKTRWKFRLVIINRLLEKFLPWNKLQFSRPWVFCSYINDPKAKTIIFPKNDNTTVTVNGSHSVLMNSFVGFCFWWPGRFEISPFDMLPRVIVGKARFVVTLKN